MQMTKMSEHSNHIFATEVEFFLDGRYFTRGGSVKIFRAPSHLKRVKILTSDEARTTGSKLW